MPRERNGGGGSEFFTHPRYVSLSVDRTCCVRTRAILLVHTKIVLPDALATAYEQDRPSWAVFSCPSVFVLGLLRTIDVEADLQGNKRPGIDMFDIRRPIDDFHTTFSASEGDGVYVAPESTPKIW